MYTIFFLLKDGFLVSYYYSKMQKNVYNFVSRDIRNKEKLGKEQKKITFWQRLLYFIPNVILLRFSSSLFYIFFWVLHDLISLGHWIRNTPTFMEGFFTLFLISIAIWLMWVLITTAKKKLYSWWFIASLLCFLGTFGFYCIQINTARERKNAEEQRELYIQRELRCKQMWYDSCSQMHLYRNN